MNKKGKREKKNVEKNHTYTIKLKTKMVMHFIKD